MSLLNIFVNKLHAFSTYLMTQVFKQENVSSIIVCAKKSLRHSNRTNIFVLAIFSISLVKVCFIRKTKNKIHHIGIPMANKNGYKNGSALSSNYQVGNSLDFKKLD